MLLVWFSRCDAREERAEMHSIELPERLVFVLQ